METVENNVPLGVTIKESNRHILALMTKSPELSKLMKWCAEVSRFGANLTDGSLLTQLDVNEEELLSVKIYFYTYLNKYVIIARPSKNYLGAMATSRKPLAGEDDVFRGNDLYDGDFSHKTWQGILADIVAHELVRLGK